MRRRTGKSQQQVAKAAGTSAATVCRVEAGMEKRLSVDLLERITEASGGVLPIMPTVTGGVPTSNGEDW